MNFKPKYYPIFVSILFLILFFLSPNCSARTIFVSPSGSPDGVGESWETAFNTITAGLTASASGDEIWVRSATYPESIEMKEGIALYGGFAGNETNRNQRDWTAHETVIDASGLKKSVVKCSWISSATLDGFILTGGRADEGGGINFYNSSPTIMNCQIIHNYAYYGGGGIYSEESEEKIINCIIADNEATGLGGGLSYQYSYFSPRVINCSIIRNTAIKGAGLYYYGAIPIISNCILWNRGTEIDGYDVYGGPVVTFCAVQGGWEGEGNISAEPALTQSWDGNRLDIHLLSGSPCIDAGTPVADVLFDFEGNPRPSGSGWDIGADECVGDCEPGNPQQEATIWYVASGFEGGDGSSWESPFSTITTALDYAKPLDEIWVRSATYQESIILEPGVGLYGGFAGNETERNQRTWTTNITIINPEDKNDRGVLCNRIESATLDGFTITDSKYGIYCMDSNPTVRNCVIRNSNLTGVYCYESSPTIIDCIISENKGEGVYCDNSSLTVRNCEITYNDDGGFFCHTYNSYSSPTLINCNISNNRTSNNGGGILCYGSSPAIINCTIINNFALEEGNGIYVSDSSSATMTNCIIWNKGSEIACADKNSLTIQYSCIQQTWPGEGNISVSPMFVDAENDNFHLQEGSPCIDRGLVSSAPPEDIEGNSRPGSDGLVDMGAYETPDDWLPGPSMQPTSRWYVRSNADENGDGTSWETAFASISFVLEIMSASDTIWIGEGTYHETITLEPGITLYGGFAGNETTIEARNWQVHETIIDATGFNLPAVSILDDATLDGLTLSGGWGTWDNMGGGIHCRNSDPVITNCSIIGNKSFHVGGAYFYNSYPTLLQCSISNNYSYTNAGGLSFEDATPNILNCTFTDNYAKSSGGGIDCEASNLTIASCLFKDNEGGSGGAVNCNESQLNMTGCTIQNNIGGWNGGGININYHRSSSLTNCLIENNTTGHDGGGIYCEDTELFLTNCTITNNSSSYYGGGLYFEDADPYLTNCTIVNNIAKNGGSGLYREYCTPDLINCILWNYRDEIAGTDSNNTDITYSCINGGWEGEGNIYSNPLFVDSAGGDYRLQSGSPCIDSGTEVPGVFLDYEGDPRPSGGGWDMGADECAGGCTPGVPEPAGRVWYVAAGATGGDGSSWESPLGSISAALDWATISNEIWVIGATYEEAIILKEGVGLYGGFAGFETAREQRDWQKHQTIIDASGLRRSVVICSDITSATLDGFILTGGDTRDRSGGGVSCSESSLTLENCTITRNNAGSGGGIYCYQGSPTITNCIIRDNSAYYHGGGLYIYESNPIVYNCSIINNSVDNCTNYLDVDGGGVYCDEASPTLINCTIAGNTATGTGSGVYCIDYSPTFLNCTITGNSAFQGSCIFSEGSSLAMTNCILWNRGNEIEEEYQGRINITYCAVQGGWDGEGNIAINPGLTQMWDGETVDMHLLADSPCIDAGIALAEVDKDFEGDPRSSGNGWDIGADECTGNCEHGEPPQAGRIWYVAAGFEFGDGSSWGNPLGSITEALERALPTDEVWVHSGIYKEIILMEPGVSLYGGFTGHETSREQRSANPNQTVIDASNLYSSVVTCRYIDSATLDGFTLTGGFSISGGGVCCYESSPTLSNCIITGCSSTGSHDEGGGGVFCFSSSPVLKNCLIWNNSAILVNGGGISCNESAPTFLNCTITGNSASSSYGGAGSFEESDPVFYNCTITGNTAYNYGGLDAGDTTITLMNCILMNEGEEITDHYYVETNVTYTCIEGGWEGEGNIDSDPLFVNAAGGDYRLQPGSSCIDAGNPDVSYNDACLPPGQGGVRNDMGVYGGPENCMGIPEVPTPIPTSTSTATPTPVVTSTPTPTPFITPLPGQYQVWVLDGLGRVQKLDEVIE